MTTISAKIIADSVSEASKRLTTLHLRYPRFIHAELMTHRVFSRNARSSRAVPIEKMIEEIKNDPVIPLHWGAAQKGMQADHECDAPVLGYKYDAWGYPLPREESWLQARDEAVLFAEAFAAAGYHKQVVNRLLEPFMHIDVLVTATEWDNFFALRDHAAAEPHFQMLARAIRKAMEESTPNSLWPGDWHLPYVTDEDRRAISGDTMLMQAKEPPYQDGLDRAGVKPYARLYLMLSVARCARISYTPFDGNGDIASEMKRYDLLRTSGHWSPFEHQATPDFVKGYSGYDWEAPEEHGNFVGWRQNLRIVEAKTGEAA